MGCLHELIGKQFRGSNNGDGNCDYSQGFGKQLYRGCLQIDSLTNSIQKPFEIIAIIKNGVLIYNNIYNDSRYVPDDDGWSDFTGPVFKIMLSLSNGEFFNIFYGVVTSDRAAFMDGVTPRLLDSFTVEILKELMYKCHGIYDLRYYVSAPTQYTYHLYRGDSFYYLTTNTGNDAFYIGFKGKILQGDKDKVLDYMMSLNSANR